MSVRHDSRGLVVRSMWIAAALFAAKAAVGLLTGSLSVLASALDSLMDLCSSAVNYVSIGIARSPADEEHQYGHEKAEALASLFQGAFIGLGALALVAESVRRLLHPHLLSGTGWGLGIMAAAIAASMFHGLDLRHAALEEGSSILGVESAHFLTDVASNVGVLGALALVRATGSPWWDPAVTMLVVAFSLRLTAPIVLDAIAELMDEGLPEGTRAEIERLILDHHPSVVGFHNFRSRRAGLRRYIEFHLELRGVREFIAAHEITEDLVEKIRTAVPQADVMIHADPEGGR